MTHIDTTLGTQVGSNQGVRELLVLVVEDGVCLSDAFLGVCDCLHVAVERMPTRAGLDAVLRNRRPMAVVAEVDGVGQDGCHVLMRIAAHDRHLPVLLITGDDPALIGAVDAVEEVWNLTSVTKWPQLQGVGGVVDFLFRAGHKGGCLRLISV